MVVKLLEMKNRTYYFWDDTILITDFDPKLLKLDKKESPTGIAIYYIGYITKKAIYSINSVNPLYLVVRSLKRYVEEIENSADRYLVLSPVSSNKIILDKFNEIWKGIKDQIFKINGSVKEYDENYNKIRFNSNFALPLNASVKSHALTVVIRYIIEKTDKYYPEIYLDDALCDL